MAGTTFSTGNWTGYVEHSADITEGTSALTDFSLIIDIAELVADSGGAGEWGGYVHSDGGDIRCTDESNVELPFDLIDWNYTNSTTITGLIRVKRSLSASSTSEKVRVWAGYTGGTAVAYDATETYGSDNAYDANWEGYWPLHDANDRTANSYDLTAVGLTVGTATGPMGAATEFSGTAQYLYGSIGEMHDVDKTVIASVEVDTIASKYNGILSIGDSATDSSPNTLFRIQQNFGTLAAFGAKTGGGFGYIISDPEAVSINTPAHVTFRQTAATHIFDLFLDGSETSYLAGTDIQYDDYADTANTVYLGSGYNGALDGTMSHVQLHSTPRSDEWISHEYDQTSANATFWGTWTWSAAPVGGFGGVSNVIGGGIAA